MKLGEVRQSGSSQTLQCFLMLGGMLAAVLAPLILFIEAFEWFFSREWPGLTLADGLSLFGIYHEAAETASQRAIDVALAVPLTVSLFLAGISMFLLGVNSGNWEEERRLERDVYEDPILALALLVSGNEIGLTSFLRLVVLGQLLRFLLVAGGGAMLCGAGLFIAGRPSYWLLPVGAALVVMTALSRRSVSKKLARDYSGRG